MQLKLYKEIFIFQKNTPNYAIHSETGVTPIRFMMSLEPNKDSRYVKPWFNKLVELDGEIHLKLFYKVLNWHSLSMDK